MPIPRDALELENAHRGPNGQPTLARAFSLLREAWRGGDRDRELALHLLFVCWYGLLEPEHITGFKDDEETANQLRRTFGEVHGYAEPGIERDPEMLYTVGLMANLAPWLLGDLAEWEDRSNHYRRLYRALAPEGLDPAVFDGRGAYGEYFGSQARVPNGY